LSVNSDFILAMDVVHFTLKVLLSLDGVVFGKPHYTKDWSPFLVN